jgi:hypothetical protein
MRMKKKKRLSKKEKAKRKEACDSLCGIWSHLPKSVLKELMKKTY